MDAETKECLHLPAFWCRPLSLRSLGQVDSPLGFLALRLLLLRLFAVIAFVISTAAVQAEQSSTRTEISNEVLDRARSTLDEVEKELAKPAANEQVLRLLRERVAPMPGELQDVIDRLAPRLRHVEALLKELGSPSRGANAPSPASSASAANPVAAPAPAPSKAQPPPNSRALAKSPAKGETKTTANSPKSAPPHENPAVANAPAPQSRARTTAADSATADVNAEWAEQRKRYDDTDATLKRARSLLVESQQVLVKIVALQRALFAKTLFMRTKGMFSPLLWREAASEAPQTIVAAREFVEERADNVLSRLNDGAKGEFIALLSLILLAIPLLLFLAGRVLARSETVQHPGKYQKAAAAGWTALVTIAVPLFVLIAFGALIDAFDLVDATLEPILQRIFEGATRVMVAYGLARALMAPDHPDWRLVNPGDPLARRLTRLVAAVVAILSVMRVLEQFEETMQAALGVVIVTRGMGALLCGALLAATLAGFPRNGEARPGAGRDWLALTRLLGYGVVMTVVTACGLGYITFANFFILQLSWTLAVIAVLSIALLLARWGVDVSFAPTGIFGRAAINIIGVDRHALGPFAELLAGVSALALIGVAGLFLLAPFGVDSGDFLGNLQSSFLVVKIGDVSISPSSALTALVLFFLAFAATQGLRGWLDGRFLPLTKLDSGLRNSIGTSVGYAGFILAISIALSELGLGFDKLAIVAGALSVGIGFGLQSIVNNFVSGLILLWERAVRVGDWVVIGDEQGYVKRINVRSTEIETFDRATMIVPNSNLVTGVVKNWLRGDKVGRIKITLAPSSSVDPEQIRDILLAAARAQDGVLRIPAPQVMFLAMESNLFRFELWCYVEDVEESARLRSDLHFDLHKRLADAGVNMAPAPTPPTVVKFSGFDKFAAAPAKVVVEQEVVEDEIEKIHDGGSKRTELVARV